MCLSFLDSKKRQCSLTWSSSPEAYWVARSRCVCVWCVVCVCGFALLFALVLMPLKSQTRSTKGIPSQIHVTLCAMVFRDLKMSCKCLHCQIWGGDDPSSQNITKCEVPGTRFCCLTYCMLGAWFVNFSNPLWVCDLSGHKVELKPADSKLQSQACGASGAQASRTEFV